MIRYEIPTIKKYLFDFPRLSIHLSIHILNGNVSDIFIVKCPTVNYN